METASEHSDSLDKDTKRASASNPSLTLRFPSFSRKSSATLQELDHQRKPFSKSSSFSLRLPLRKNSQGDIIGDDKVSPPGMKLSSNHSSRSRFSFSSRINSDQRKESDIASSSSPNLLDLPVVETTTVVRDYDKETGNKMLNNYMLFNELGRGCYGKVKLCIDTVTGEKWAVKIVDKHVKNRFQSKLSAAHRLAAQGPDTQLTKVKKEIAILKKCRHAHVVRLKEVIDDPSSDKIYMILEYLEGGEVLWHDNSDPPKPCLGIGEVRQIFRDLCLGVQYCK